MAATTRTSTWRTVASPPTRVTSPVSSTRSSLACSRQRQLADLVEEERAAVRPLERRRRAPRSAPVNAPLLVAEQLGLDERLGDGGAVDGDERRALRAVRE